MSTLNSELTANPYQADQKRNEVKAFTYDRWMESVGIPIHRGFFIEDLRTVELGWWDERQCDAAFIQLTGQEGITSAIVMEIAPGEGNIVRLEYVNLLASAVLLILISYIQACHYRFR